MNQPQNDRIDLLMQGDWSKAFVALGRYDRTEIRRMRRRQFWKSLLLPKATLASFLG